MTTSTEFQNRLATSATTVQARLDEILVQKLQTGETSRPPRLLQAMRHGVLNGGKRLRPFLVLESAKLFGISANQALQTACALECLHCYSLIHDDLPAMDDDDLRRGQPTVHVKYDEATAVLAGDALLTLAFDLITDPANHSDPAIRAELALLLARASGLGGMIGGQMLDLEAEKKPVNETGIRTLQAMKTGALLRFACEAGAVLGSAEHSERQNLISFGEAIGLAFQLADDLLDVTSDTATLGKTAGKDIVQEKATLVSLHGVEPARRLLNKAVEQATHHLAAFGERATILVSTARFIAERRS